MQAQVYDESDHYPHGHVPHKNLHIILLVDSSESMSGKKASSLNKSIGEMIEELRLVQRGEPQLNIFIRAVEFSTGARWIDPFPIPIHEYAWRPPRPSGLTSLGAGIELLNEGLDPALLGPDLLPPLVVLISDGAPTDDWMTPLQELNANPLGDIASQRSIRIAIGIGKSVDHEVMNRFTQNRNHVFNARNAHDLRQYLLLSTVELSAAVPRWLPQPNPEPRERPTRGARDRRGRSRGSAGGISLREFRERAGDPRAGAPRAAPDQAQEAPKQPTAEERRRLVNPGTRVPPREVPLPPQIDPDHERGHSPWGQPTPPPSLRPAAPISSPQAPIGVVESPQGKAPSSAEPPLTPVRSPRPEAPTVNSPDATGGVDTSLPPVAPKEREWPSAARIDERPTQPQRPSPELPTSDGSASRAVSRDEARALSGKQEPIPSLSASDESREIEDATRSNRHTDQGHAALSALESLLGGSTGGGPLESASDAAELLPSTANQNAANPFLSAFSSGSSGLRGSLMRGAERVAEADLVDWEDYDDD